MASIPTGRLARLLATPVPLAALAAGLVFWLAADQLLLWCFLGIAAWWALALGGLGVAGLTFAAWSFLGGRRAPPGPSLATLLVCLSVAFVLLLLSGEGRFFYANTDWQVRNAVLGDMGRNRWPFVYAMRGQIELLRAPLGIYLAPALVYQALGERAAAIAMLLQNSVLIGTMLAAASTLFDGARLRRIALLIFIMFSGADLVGILLTWQLSHDHLEFWSIAFQYSSTITLLFWVPNHAVSGWVTALAWLLWRDRRAPVGLLFILAPLSALWSPLALIGTMPFAMHAGLTTLLRRELSWRDVAFPALAVLLAAPTLLYLSAASDAVGLKSFQPPISLYLTFIAIEVLPLVLPMLLAGRSGRIGAVPLAICAVILLALPLMRVNGSVDLMTRGSIPALTILCVAIIDHVTAGPAARFRTWLIVLLCIGSVTGTMEVIRAFRHPAAPAISCSMFKTWDMGNRFAYNPKASYLAPLAKVPPLVRPRNPATALTREPYDCWQGTWYRPSGV